MIDTGDQATILSTGPNGDTKLVMVPSGGVLSLRLQETHLADGVALGQLFDVAGPTGMGSGDWSDRIVTQPLAVPVTITSAQPVYSNYHNRWVFQPVELPNGTKPGYRFAAHVATLLTAAEIAAYKAYYGLNTPSFDGSLGVVVRSSAVDLGQENVSLEIDCAGHGFVEMPTAKCFVVRGPAQGVPPPTLSASVLHWESERAHLVLSGVLERGDNVILLSPTPSTQAVERLERFDEEFTAPPPEESATSGGPQCTPPDGPQCVGNNYSSGGTPPCTPSPAPQSDAGCTAAVPDEIYCHGWATGGPQLCGYQGTTGSQSVAVTLGGSVSVSGTAGIPGNTVSVTATGSASTTVTAAVTIACQNGQGDCSACNGSALCGTCARLCMKFTSCTQKFTVTKDGWKVKRWAEFGIPSITWVKTPCTEQTSTTIFCWTIDGAQQELCDRHCP